MSCRDFVCQCASGTKIVAHVKDPMSTFHLKEGLRSDGIETHR